MILEQSEEATVYALFALAMVVTLIGTFLGIRFAASLFSTGLILFLVIAEFAILLTSRWWMNQSPLNVVLFCAFPLISGITVAPIILSVIQDYANGSSILINALASTAFMAAAAAVFARTTRWNLGIMGKALFFSVFGLAFLGILQLFIPTLQGGAFELMLSGAGIVVMALFTAFDVQRIQTLGRSGANPFLLALSLYLDIFNLFLYVLRFMLAISGNRRR